MWPRKPVAPPDISFWPNECPPVPQSTITSVSLGDRTASPPELYPHVASSKLTQADDSESRTAVCVGTTKGIALIGPVAETDPFIASGDVAKSQRCTSSASDMPPTDREIPDEQRPTSVSPPCVSYFTQPAQIRHAIVRSFFGNRPRSR